MPVGLYKLEIVFPYDCTSDPGILEVGVGVGGGGGQGPKKGRSVGIFKLTSKENSEGGGVKSPKPPGSATDL